MESSQKMEKARGWEEKGLGSSQRMEKDWWSSVLLNSALVKPTVTHQTVI